MNTSELSQEQVEMLLDLLLEAYEFLPTVRGGVVLLEEIFQVAGPLNAENCYRHICALGSKVIFDVTASKAVAVGFIRLDGVTAHLAIYVAREARSQGIGANLFQRLLTEARKGGATRFDVVVLPGDRPMKQLCEKSGLKARKLTMALSDAVPGPVDEEAGEEF